MRRRSGTGRPVGIARILAVVVFGGLVAARVGTAQSNSAENEMPANAGGSSFERNTGLTLMDVLQASLEKNPQLKIEEYSVEAQKGELRSEKGKFDWLIQTNGNQQRSYDPVANGATNPPQLAELMNISTSSVSAIKEFRNGIVIAPGLQLNRTVDPVNYPGGINEAAVGLQIQMPLLRNRGTAAVDAGELSARKQLLAVRLDLSQQVSDTLAKAAIGYWNFVAASATLAVYRASAARGNDLLKGTETLVEADRLPANDLNQARANLASRVASVTAAEQNLLQARQQLVLVMGLSADRILSLPPPAQDIPDIIPLFDPTLLDSYLRLAHANRADVLAAGLRVEANSILEEAAKNQLKPQLDVSSTVGYGSFLGGTGFSRLPNSVVEGPKEATYTVGINYSQSRGNNVAKGQLQSAVAVVRQSEITLSETERTAATAAVVAFEGVRSTTTQLQKAREAVQFYQAALDGEREKYHLGLSSLVEVLTVEDRLTSVLLDEVNARLAYASALVQLRQATGTIVQAGQDIQQVDPYIFSSLPDINGSNVMHGLPMP